VKKVGDIQNKTKKQPTLGARPRSPVSLMLAMPNVTSVLNVLTMHPFVGEYTRSHDVTDTTWKRAAAQLAHLR